VLALRAPVAFISECNWQNCANAERALTWRSSLCELPNIHEKKSKLDIEYEKITAEDIAEREAVNTMVVTCLEMLEHVQTLLSQSKPA